MFREWNKKILLLVLVPALQFACIYTAKRTGIRTPQTGVDLPTSSPPAPTGGNAPSSAPQVNAGTYVTIKVQEGTTTRSADLYIPAKYSNTSGNVPLILSFHGYGGSGAGHGTLTGLDALADTYGLLTAYPDGLPIDPNNLNKGLHWTVDSGSPDVQFIRDLITKMESLNYRVDPSRIYATGISNGGGMTHRVGCDLADIIAAIAPVEGGYPEPGWKDCNPTRPMPVLSFHGLPDPVVPYNGGPGTAIAAGHIFANIPEWAAAWAQRDSCNMTPTDSQYNSHVDKKVYSQCKGKATIILYSIDDNGHAWPGSSMPHASRAIKATTEIWNFFTQYTLPSP